MKTEDLYRAIGNVDQKYLEQSEKTERKGRRTVVRIGLVAAAAAALCMTAMAFPAVRNFVFGTRVQQTHAAAVHVVNGEAAQAKGSADVWLEVELPAEAPAVVETCYVPMYPAEHWSAVEQKADPYRLGRNDTYLAWEDIGGAYVIFRQLAQPGYDGSYTIDTVDLGYDAACTTGTKTVSGLELQMLTVEPSAASGGEASGSDPGRVKYYWSDGSYLFIMEVSYGMDDALLAQIVGSIAEVDSVTPYQKFSAAQPEALSGKQTVETPMQPTAIPEGWVQSGGGVQPDGSYACYWNPSFEEATMTVLEFVQTKDSANYDGICNDWAGTAGEYSTERKTQNGIQFELFTAEDQTQVIWKAEDYCFSLSSVGPNCLDAEELLAAAASVAP